MNKKIVSALVMSVLLVSSCGSNTGNTEVQKVDKITKEEQKETGNIKIPILAPVSGAVATYGEDAVNAYNLVIEEVNANGGIDGRQLELIVEDSKCSGKDAVGAVQKLINVDGAEIIVGAICSAATIPSGKVAQAKQIPMISPTSSAPDVGLIGPFVKRFWNDKNVTSVTADFVELKGFENVAIIVENTEYGIGYAESFKENFDGNVVFEEKFNPDEKDFSIIAKKLKKKLSEVDFLIIIPNSDSSIIGNIQALEKEGIMKELKGKIFGTDVAFSQVVQDTLGKELLEGMYTTSMPDISNLDEKAANFIEKFKEKHEIKSDPLFVMLEAEAINLAIDAIKEAGYDSEEIQNYLVRINENNKRKGLFGEYYFDKSEAIGLEFLVKQYVDGKIEVVK